MTNRTGRLPVDRQCILLRLRRDCRDQMSVDFVVSVLKAAEPLTTVFAMLAAVLAAIAAWLSFRLALSIRNELKSDEVLAAGVLYQPSLAHPDHENCVLVTTLFNKSKRKCVVSDVKVFDGKGSAVDVDWAATIDNLGNPQGRAQLLGIVDDSTLCIRRRDGLPFVEAVIHVTHSFDSKPLELPYQMETGWQRYFAKT